MNDGSLDDAESGNPFDREWPGFMDGDGTVLERLVFPKPLHTVYEPIAKKYRQSVLDQSDTARYLAFLDETEQATQTLFTEAQGLHPEVRHALIALSFPVLAKAVPRVEGVLGRLVHDSRPSMTGWLQATQRNDLRWIIRLRTAVEVLVYKSDLYDQASAPNGLWTNFDKFFEDQDEKAFRYASPARNHLDRVKLIDYANDPILDLLMEATEEKTPANQPWLKPPDRSDRLLLDVLARRRKPELLFLVTHGFLNAFNIYAILRTHLLRGSADLDVDGLTLICANSKAYLLTDAEKAKIRALFLKSRLAKDVAERLAARFD